MGADSAHAAGPGSVIVVEDDADTRGALLEFFRDSGTSAFIRRPYPRRPRPSSGVERPCVVLIDVPPIDGRKRAGPSPQGASRPRVSPNRVDARRTDARALRMAYARYCGSHSMFSLCYS
jgi:hypothetical protein